MLDPLWLLRDLTLEEVEIIINWFQVIDRGNIWLKFLISPLTDFLVQLAAFLQRSVLLSQLSNLRRETRNRRWQSINRLRLLGMSRLQLLIFTGFRKELCIQQHLTLLQRCYLLLQQHVVWVITRILLFYDPHKLINNRCGFASLPCFLHLLLSLEMQRSLELVVVIRHPRCWLSWVRLWNTSLHVLIISESAFNWMSGRLIIQLFFRDSRFIG